MTFPGIKFRGANRWITPQMHEMLFRRSGGAAFSGGTVTESTVRTGVGTFLATSITLTNFQVTSDVVNAQLIACVSTRDSGLGTTTTGVTWNGHALTEIIEGVHPGGLHTASIHRWIITAGDLGATSNIVAIFSDTTSSSLICAYVVQNVSTDLPEDEGVATVSNVATVSIPLTLASTNDLVLDWFTHVYAVPVNPSPTGTGQLEIAGAQADDAAGLRGEGSRISSSVSGSTTMSWSGLDTTSSSTVQVALAFKPFFAPTQPVTAKLAVGYDFSGIDSVITVTGAGISNVTDSSGNSNAGTQATDARRLLYGSTTINGRLAADSNADVNKNVTLPSSITNYTNNGQPPFHFLIVFVAGTWATANIFGFQNAGSAPRSAFRLSTSGGNRVEGRVPIAGPGANTILSTQTTLTTGTTYLAELSVDGGGAASLIVNEGTAATSTSATSGESLSRRFVGDLGGGGNVKYGAVYIFNDALTAPELASWRTFLKYRWGYV